jgi:hypothetical protein
MALLEWERYDDLPPGWDQWRVELEKVRGGKKKCNRKQTVFVRASNAETALQIGRAVSGLRYGYAVPYRPWRDMAFRNYVVAASN